MRKDAQHIEMARSSTFLNADGKMHLTSSLRHGLLYADLASEQDLCWGEAPWPPQENFQTKFNHRPVLSPFSWCMLGWVICVRSPYSGWRRAGQRTVFVLPFLKNTDQHSDTNARFSWKKFSSETPTEKKDAKKFVLGNSLDLIYTPCRHHQTTVSDNFRYTYVMLPGFQWQCILEIKIQQEDHTMPILLLFQRLWGVPVEIFQSDLDEESSFEDTHMRDNSSRNSSRIQNRVPLHRQDRLTTRTRCSQDRKLIFQEQDSGAVKLGL